MHAAIPVFLAFSAAVAFTQPESSEPAGASTWPVYALELESGWTLGGTSWCRCAIASNGLRVMVACHDFSAWETDVAFGFSVPWMSAGPLRPTGLLREASNPMGYAAGSEVLRERTALRLDGSFPSATRGLIWMPAPGALGLFLVEGKAEAPALGGIASLMPLPGLGVEGALLLEQPPPTPLDEAWLVSSVPWPGGKLLRTALRIVADAPGLCLAAAFGSTLAERALPGMFWRLGCDASGAAFSASVLLAGATRSYFLSDGSTPSHAARVDYRLCFDGPGRSLRLRSSWLVDQPGFVPHRFLGGKDSAGISFQQSGPAFGPLRLSLAADAEKTVTRPLDGGQSEGARCALTLRAAAGECALEAGIGAEMGVDDTDGLGLSASLELGGADRPCRATLGARLEVSPTARMTLAVSGAARITRRETSWSVEAGVEGAAPGCAIADLAAGLRLALTWSVRSAALTIARPAPPRVPG